MKNRNPIAVFLLGFVTLGLYSWYWIVKTKGEMNKQGEKIPTAWLWLIPVVGNLYWSWRYSEGVGNVTRGKLDTVLCFILLMLLGGVGHAIIQHYFNEFTGSPAVANGQPQAAFPQPVAPIAPAAYQPAAPVVAPVAAAPVQPAAVGDGAEPASQPFTQQ